MALIYMVSWRPRTGNGGEIHSISDGSGVLFGEIEGMPASIAEHPKEGSSEHLEPIRIIRPGAL